ncbi:MAG: DNA topoisomerase VI subunit B [Acidobacteria bacterium]|nr:DNA topoisomerase VI subunit B [Acidobacteriota bacterium]
MILRRSCRCDRRRRTIPTKPKPGTLSLFPVREPPVSAKPGTAVRPRPKAGKPQSAEDHHPRQLSLIEPSSPVRPDRAVQLVPAVAEPVETAAVGSVEAPAERAARPARRQTAESLASRQREISVSEFFTKNRHLLGFDNPQKALLTAIKEAVDNSLDACEEAGLLPVLKVNIDQLAEDRFHISVEDNGPGIVKAQIPKIFGKLLYGSKFHTLKQARGQQGIGISAAGMYGLLTTGKSIAVTSRTGSGKPAHYYEIQIDTRKNTPQVITDKAVDWEPAHGTKVEIELVGTYKRGRHSVDDYIRQTAIANPHAEIFYDFPGGEGSIHFPRSSNVLPPAPRAIKPHPYGVELRVLIKMLKETTARRLDLALKRDFSRVSEIVAEKICEAADLRPSSNPHLIAVHEAERLYRAINSVKIMSPPTNCLSPIGEEQILAGLKKVIPASFFTAVSRSPAVYRGNPFLVEVGMAYGGSLPSEDLVDLFRFANRVPLQYQQSACAITKAVLSIDWRSYGLSQSKGALPTGPVVLFVHIASVWVPFTSESKEAIAAYPEIIRELRLALQDCGRRLATHIRAHRRAAEEEKKRSYIERYIPHIGIALREILGLARPAEEELVATLKEVLERSRSREPIE